MRLKLPFEKWTGAGNDFIILRQEELPPQIDGAEVARPLCDRHFGIGADGLVILSGTKAAFWNCDGSTAAFCGNASRCIGKSLLSRRDRDAQSEAATPPFSEIHFFLRNVEVTAVIEPDSRVCVTVPPPVPGSKKMEDHYAVELRRIPKGKLVIENICSIVAGVPHLVIILKKGCQIDKSDFEFLAYTVMENQLIDPTTGRHNVTMVQEDIGNDRSAIRTWELGVDGETLACGSGALAAAAALGPDIQQIHLRTAGGNLLEVEKSELKWRLRGPAVQICHGVAEL